MKIEKYFKQKSREVLKLLEKVNSVYLASDTDVDGICACWLFYRILKKIGKSDIYLNFPYGKGSYQEKIQKIVKNFEKSKRELLVLLDLNLENVKTKKKILIIDHHAFIPKAKNVLIVNPREIDQKIYLPTSSIIFYLFENFFERKWFLASVIGTLGDYGFSKKLFKEFEKHYPKFLNMKNFKKSKVFLFVKNLNAFRIVKRKNDLKKFVKNFDFEKIDKLKKYRKIVEKEIKKELRNFTKNKIKFEKDCYLYFKKSKLPIRSTIATIIGDRLKKKIVIVLEKVSEKEAFFSIRRGKKSRKNLLKFLEKIEKLGIVKKYGGHPEAAAGIIDLKALKSLIKI